jgi:hypothetical protein
MSESRQRDVAESFVTAIRNGDKSLLASVATEDIVWTVPGTSLMSGQAFGVEGILARAEVIKRFGVKTKLEHIVYGYEDVAIRLHNTGERTGLILDEYLATVLRLRDGRIYRIDSFVSDVGMVNSFFVDD